MDTTTLIVIAAAILAVLVFKSTSQVSAAAAVAHLQAGARVVDVRTPEEFAGDKLPGASNIPLGDLANQAPRQLPDKQQVILVHCLSGGRSLVAMRQLRALGYTRTFNLGSVGRARRILQQAGRL